jgi:hypothetical protein
LRAVREHFAAQISQMMTVVETVFPAEEMAEENVIAIVIAADR